MGGLHLTLTIASSLVKGGNGGREFSLMDSPAANAALPDSSIAPNCYQLLYGKNLPFNVSKTRSPLGSSIFSTSIEKSIALMIPSPNFS